MTSSPTSSGGLGTECNKKAHWRIQCAFLYIIFYYFIDGITISQSFAPYALVTTIKSQGLSISISI